MCILDACLVTGADSMEKYENRSASQTSWSENSEKFFFGKKKQHTNYRHCFDYCSVFLPTSVKKEILKMWLIVTADSCLNKMICIIMKPNSQFGKVPCFFCF